MTTIKRWHFAVLAFCLFPVSLSWADTLKFKNGSTLIGTYAGGSDRDVAFRVGATVQHYAIGDIASLSFDSNSAVLSSDAPPPAPEPAPDQPTSSQQAAPTYQAFSNTVTVPAGTHLVVRTIDPIDSDKNHVGDRFEAALAEPLYVNDLGVAPRGATVYGRLEEVKQAGQFAGRSQLRLALTGIVINGQTVPLTTGEYELSGKSRGADTAKKVGAGTALGAVIGAVAGGGKGAAIGAGVGAGAGTAVQVVTKGEQVHVPSETILEFTLDQPITVTRAQ